MALYLFFILVPFSLIFFYPGNGNNGGNNNGGNGGNTGGGDGGDNNTGGSGSVTDGSGKNEYHFSK